MNAYAYRAALYCEPCADDVKRRLAPQFGFRRMNSRGVAISDGTLGSADSHHWPQGPRPDGGGEADTAQHCAACAAPLGNPLTAADAPPSITEQLFALGGSPSAYKAEFDADCECESEAS
jgi:hypothetical protein